MQAGRGGGHVAAGGLSLPAAARPLLDLTLRSQLRTWDRIPSLPASEVLPLALANGALLSQLAQLAPFGEGHPLPLFRFEDLRVRAVETPGVAGMRPAMLRVQDDEGTERQVRWFLSTTLPEVLGVGARIDLTAEIKIGAKDPAHRNHVVLSVVALDVTVPAPFGAPLPGQEYEPAFEALVDAGVFEGR